MSKIDLSNRVTLILICHGLHLQMGKKLYVGNLSFDMSDEELGAAFSEFGEVVSAVVVKDRISGRSRGFGTPDHAP